jgi:hypothetical protein
MKVSFFEKVYVGILMIIFAGVIVHAPLSVWLGTLFPDYDLLIKSWKELLMIICVPLAIGIVSGRKLWRQLWGDWIFRLIVLYTTLHLVLAGLLYDGLAVTAAGLAIDLRYVLFFGLMYVAIRIMPVYRRPMIVIGSIGASIVVGFATLQFFLPADILSHIGYGRETIMPYLTVDKNPDYIRINSTLRGPNPLGAYAGMVLGLLAAALIRMKLNLKDRRVRFATILFGVCSIVALWLSYSRSALVAGLVTLLIVVVFGVKRIPRVVWVTGAIVGCGILGGLVLGRESSFILNILLHENKDGGSSVSSNDGHIESLSYGIDRLVHQPLGGGIGSTGSASLYGEAPVVIENQYLFVAHETGWLGLVVFVVLYILILARLWRGRADWLSLGLFGGGVGLAAIGLLLPVWVDDTVAIVWWGLAAIALAGGRYARKQAN